MRATIQLSALHFCPDQRCQVVDWTVALERAQQSSDPVWIHVEANNDPAASDFLQQEVGMHPLAIEDALSDQERPSLTVFDEDIFLTIEALRASPHSDDFLRRDHLAALIRNNLMITVSHGPAPVIHQVFDRVQRSSRYNQESVGMLLHTLIDTVVDDYFPILDELDNDMEDVSDRIIAGSTEQLPELVRLKRTHLEFRRAVAPMREIVNGLLRLDHPALPPKTELYFQDVFDHVLRTLDNIDLNRDSLASLVDLHLSEVSNQLNDVIKRMTVFSTSLMTMALVAGIYGMNFERMPELSWAFGYPMALGIMLLAGLGVVLLFRRFRWI